LGTRYELNVLSSYLIDRFYIYELSYRLCSFDDVIMEIEKHFETIGSSFKSEVTIGFREDYKENYSFRLRF